MKRYLRLTLKLLYTGWVVVIRTIFLLILIEITLYVAIKLDSLRDLPGAFTILEKGAPIPESYIAVNWYEDYTKEFSELTRSVAWSSYVYKRLKYFKGQYINIDKNSKRKTWSPPSANNNSLKVFMFGGSTMWGWGARDNYTIPSLVSKILYYEYGINAEVINFGQLGFISTQEVIFLIKELHHQNFPKIVIFYDGLNDIFCALRPGQTGTAGVPCDECDRKEAFEREKVFKDSNLLGKIVRTYLHHSTLYYIICKSLGPHSSVTLTTSQLEQLSNNIINIYQENMKIVNSLSEAYQFKALFYWQPIIFTKDHLTTYEKKLEKAGETHLYSKPLYNLVYKKISRLQSNRAFHNISEILSTYRQAFYIDYSHIDEKGNEIIARKIAKDISRTQIQ